MDALRHGRYAPVCVDENLSKTIRQPGELGSRNPRWAAFIAGAGASILLVFAGILVGFYMHASSIDADTIERQWPQAFPLVLQNFTDWDDRKQQSSGWNEIWLEGIGVFAAIEDPQEHGLPPGLPLTDDNSIQYYSMAVFHQLHCVASLKATIERLLITINGTEGWDKVTNIADDMHSHHCIDYLRQSIQCSGDMTLEGYVSSGHGQHNVSGWTGTHVCRDWNAITDFAFEHGLAKFYQSQNVSVNTS